MAQEDNRWFPCVLVLIVWVSISLAQDYISREDYEINRDIDREQDIDLFLLLLSLLQMMISIIIRIIIIVRIIISIVIMIPHFIIVIIVDTVRITHCYYCSC